MLKNSTKMVEAAAAQDLECWVERCRRPIRTMELYFLDVLWDRVYCHQCGLCVRFRRNRALKRGEHLEAVETEP